MPTKKSPSKNKQELRITRHPGIRVGDMLMTLSDIKLKLPVIPVDSYGYNNNKGIYRLHVYSNKRQVNINRCSYNDDQGISVLNICFTEDTCRMYFVSASGVADYDHPLEYSLDTDIANTVAGKYSRLFE